MKKKIRRSSTKRKKSGGFRALNKTHSGKKCIARRRRKGTRI